LFITTYIEKYWTQPLKALVRSSHDFSPKMRYGTTVMHYILVISAWHAQILSQREGTIFICQVRNMHILNIPESTTILD